LPARRANRPGTLDSGDGAPVGSYQVAVVDARGEDMDDPTPIRIHARYRRYETSALTFAVGDGTNEWEIRLDPPGQSARQKHH